MIEKLIEAYRAAVAHNQRSIDYRVSHGTPELPRDKRLEAAERLAMDNLRAYLSTHYLAISQRHVHECGTCGQFRECYHMQCYFNVLADCDPGYGCRTPKRTT